MDKNASLVAKRDKIKQSLKATKAKRKLQSCFVRELKINTSHLNKENYNNLNLLFIEAKWLHNALLSSNNINDFDLSKSLTQVSGFDKNHNPEMKPMRILSSQMKQTIQFQLKADIKSLSTKKKKGFNVGALKYVSEVNSIDLKQYNVTWGFKDDFKKISIQGIKTSLKVHGIKQFKFNELNYDFANAKLIKKATGFFLKITYYLYKNELSAHNQELKSNIGLDFGIKTHITTSNGESFNILIKESESLKKAQRAFSKTQKGSNNRYKLRLHMKKLHEKIANQRIDKANKIVSYLQHNYNTIFLQDENIAGWHKGAYGKTIQHSALGTIKSKLMNLEQSTIINRASKSTKQCFCGNEINLGLNERTFHCPFCGYKEDRDIKAAKIILHWGETKQNIINKKAIALFNLNYEKSLLRIAETIKTELNQ